MELVTGHGASEHITAAQVSRFIQGITVMDDTTVYRLNVGNDCSLIIGGLDVLINTGEMVLHGYHTTFEDAYQVTLDPTLNAAYSRIDKLCLIVSEDLTTGIQSAYIQVVQGTESANPSAPATPSTPSSLTEMYLGVGVIATVTVSDSIIASYVDNTSLYAGSFVTKTEYDNDLAQTRQMIAPIEATNVVSKVGGYVKDDRLIYNGVLYKVDANTISEGATLVPNGNISLSPDVEAQISSLKSSLSNFIEYDSNANGSYWKFADGTLICARGILATSAMVTWTAFGNIYKADITVESGSWAYTFNSTPYVVAQNVSPMASVESITAGTHGISLISLSRATSYSSNYNINVIAIGRWK